MATRRVKVCVIGGGISGLGCANYLINNGLDDLVVLEATDRLGGRIWSIDLETDKSHRVELGANWIHGNDANPIFEVAKQNNLLSTQYEGRHLGRKMLFVLENGDPVNPRVIQEVDLSFGMLMNECDEFYKNQEPTPVEDDSVGAFVEREFEEKLIRHSGRERKLREMVLQQRLYEECMICGADSMHDIALSEVGCFEDLPGVHFVIPPGFETIIDILKKDIPQDSVLLNTKVTRIRWQENDGVYIESENGPTIHADCVLVTCSLGYLKAYAARMFDPVLPHDKTDAIERIAMGTVDKVILEFDGQILPDGVFRLELIWDREGTEEEDLSTAWVRKYVFFEAVSDNVLIGWLSGREAEYMEKLSEEAVGEATVEVLSKFLKKTTPVMPKLVRVTRSQWKSHPFMLGAYCHLRVGSTAEDLVTLSKPINNEAGKPIVMFAGEATHPTFYSSSHGSLLTGRREAKRILEHYANK